MTPQQRIALRTFGKIILWTFLVFACFPMIAHAQRGAIDLAPDGTVRKFWGQTSMLAAVPLPSAPGMYIRYIASEIDPGPPGGDACAWVLTVHGRDPKSWSKYAKADDGYLLTKECFGLGGLETDLHIYYANATGWPTDTGQNFVTSQFGLGDPRQDRQVYEYILLHFKNPAADHPRVVTGKVTGGKKISGASPAYPIMAQIRREVGVEVVAATIMIDGTLGHIHITQSVGADVDRSVLDALKTWKYDPYRVNGVPTDGEPRVPQRA